MAKLVQRAVSRGKGLEELKLKDYREFSELFEQDVFEIDVKKSLAARDVTGGTAPRRVAQALARAKRILTKAAREATAKG